MTAQQKLTAKVSKLSVSVLKDIKGIRSRSVQAIGAGLSRRDWAATEVAYNDLRDAMDRLIIRLGDRP